MIVCAPTINESTLSDTQFEIKMRKEYLLHLFSLHQDDLRDKKFYLNWDYDFYSKDSDIIQLLSSLNSTWLKVKNDFTIIDLVDSQKYKIRVLTYKKLFNEYLSGINKGLQGNYHSLKVPKFLEDKSDELEGIANLGFPFFVILNPFFFKKEWIDEFKNNPSYQKAKEKLSPSAVIAHEIGHNGSDLFNHASSMYLYKDKGLQSNEEKKVFPTFENTCEIIKYEEQLITKTFIDSDENIYIL